MQTSASGRDPIEHGKHLCLSGQRALITGSGAGLGKAVAEAFAVEGALILLMDINASALDVLSRQLCERGARAHAVNGSVSDSRDVARAFDEMDRRFGGIDILVNNAGVSANAPSVEVSDETWDATLAVNLRGAFLCARAAGRRMVEQRSGVIVNIASIYGLVAAPERLAYCVSKSALIMMSRALATEWGSYGIRVNSVAPGYLRTALTEDLAQRGRIDFAQLERRTPLQRLGEPWEVAQLVTFMCSPLGSYITGQTIAIDGGWTAYGYV